MNVNMTRLLSTTGALGALNLSSVDKVPMHFMNVPLTTMVMALVGALLFHSWDDDVRELPRRKMFVSIIFFTMLSTAAVAVFPAMLGWEWYSVKLEGSLAFLVSIGAPYAIPVIKKLLPELFRKWFKLGDYNTVPRRRRSHDDDPYMGN